MIRFFGLVLILVGALAILMGGLWIGQGLGLIMWPQESFMLARPVWSVWGTVLLLVGVAVIATGMRLRRRK